MMTTSASQRSLDGGFLDLLRVVALIAVVIGGVGSLGLMLRAGRNTPRFLLVLFILWILAPFVALGWANVVSRRWSVVTRATLYCVTLVLTVSSLILYGEIVLPPEG